MNSHAPQLGGQHPADNTPIVARTIPRLVINHQLTVGYPLPPGEAEIEVVRHFLAFGCQSHSFRWAGPKTAPVFLDGQWELIYGPIASLPWKLKRIREDRLGWGGYYIRADGWLYPLAALTDAWIHLKDAGRWVTDRVVLTLMVWGLACVPQSESPSWRHIGRKRE
jgi:hypothetical protein